MSIYHSVFSIGYEQATEGMISGRAITPSCRITSLHKEMTEEDRRVFAKHVETFSSGHLGLSVVPRHDMKGAALALTGYKPQEGESIQWDRSLFDSDGYEHTLVHLGAVEVVTKYAFTYSVWNRKNGVCLREGCGDLSLSNKPLSKQELALRKAEGARMLSELHANAEAMNRVFNMLGLEDEHDPKVQDMRAQIQLPEMRQEAFLKLQAALEMMELQAAAGEDIAEHFQETFDLVESLAGAAVWTLHPDYGCVLKTQIDALDSAAELNIPPRERS